jgi:hypothetical protein
MARAGRASERTGSGRVPPCQEAESCEPRHGDGASPGTGLGKTEVCNFGETRLAHPTNVNCRVDFRTTGGDGAEDGSERRRPADPSDPSASAAAAAAASSPGAELVTAVRECFDCLDVNKSTLYAPLKVRVVRCVYGTVWVWDTD